MTEKQSGGSEERQRASVMDGRLLYSGGPCGGLVKLDTALPESC